MTIASRPLIITLRHILVAEATPSFTDATLASKPSALSSGASSAAAGPPSSSGARIRYGGNEVITAPSTNCPPAAVTIPAALIFAPGEAELQSRNHVRGRIAGAQAAATGTA